MTPPPNLPAGLIRAVSDAVSAARNESALRTIRNPQTQLSDDEFSVRILTALSPFWPGQSAEQSLVVGKTYEINHVAPRGWKGRATFKGVDVFPEYEKGSLCFECSDGVAGVFPLSAVVNPDLHAPRTDGDGAGDKARIDWLEQCNNIAIDHAKWADHMPLAGQPIIHLCEMDDDCAEVIQEIATAPTLRAAIDAAMIAPTQPDSNKERT